MSDAGVAATDGPRPAAQLSWALLALAAGAAGAGLVAGGTVAAALSALFVAAAAAAIVLKRLEYGLLALVFTLPLDVAGRIVEKPFSITVFQLVLLLCLGSWALRVIGDPKSWLRLSVMDLGMGALVLAGLWSLPTSLSRPATMMAIVRIAFLWAMALMYANGIRDGRAARRLVGALGISAVLIGLLALAQYFVPGFDLGSITDVRKYGGGIAMSRAGGFFEDPNYLGGFLSVSFSTALAMLVHLRTRRPVVLWLTVLAVTGTALLVTFSRTAWVGAFLGCLAVAATAPRGRRRWLLGAVAVIVVAALVIAPGLILERTTSIGEITRDKSVATRYYMSFSAADMIGDMPWFGTGLGAFSEAYPLYRRPGTHLSILKPHQLPQALWAEMGVAGLLAQLALAAAMVATFWRSRPRGWTDLESVAAAGVLTLLVGTLFQYYLYFEYVWLYLALSVLAVRLAKQEEEAL